MHPQNSKPNFLGQIVQALLVSTIDWFHCLDMRSILSTDLYWHDCTFLLPIRYCSCMGCFSCHWHNTLQSIWEAAISWQFQVVWSFKSICVGYLHGYPHSKVLAARACWRFALSRSQLLHHHHTNLLWCEANSSYTGKHRLAYQQTCWTASAAESSTGAFESCWAVHSWLLGFSMLLALNNDLSMSQKEKIRLFISSLVNKRD